MSAAEALFQKQGYSATTVEQIADRAGVGTRTFFRYFPSKEAVVFPQYEVRIERFRERLDDGAEDAGFERVRSAIRDVAREYLFMRNEALFQRRMIRSSPSLTAYETVIDREWEDAIVKALTETDGHSQLRARVIAAATMGAVRAAVDEWCDTGATGDLMALGERAFDLLDTGLGGSGT